MLCTCGSVGEQLQWARQAVYTMVRAVRPDAVALVDSFGFEDFLLNSAIGRKDGDVYKCAQCPKSKFKTDGSVIWS